MLEVEMENVAPGKKKSFDYSSLGSDDLFFHKLGRLLRCGEELIWSRGFGIIFSRVYGSIG